MYPDFVFFHEINGLVRASIVDPHSHHLDDATIKLKALADFAEVFGDSFHRIEALSSIPAAPRSMYVLDVTLPEVRDAVRNGTRTAVEVYKSDLAIVFDEAGKHLHGRKREGDRS